MSRASGRSTRLAHIAVAAMLFAVVAFASSATSDALAQGNGGGAAKAAKKGKGGKGGGAKNGGGVTGSAGGDGASTSEDVGFGTNNPLAIGNPFCGLRLDKRERQNCKITGTPEARYPSSNYSIDINAETGVTNPVGTFQAILAQIANAIWMFMIMILNLILTLLGWALGLDPFNDKETAGGLSSGLERFYRVFTAPWMVLAIVCIGAWTVWKGLGQRQFTQAAGGAVLAVLAMAVGLIVVHEPKGTVGVVATYTNDASQAMISAPQKGSLRNPSAGYAEATEEIWQAMTLPGFVALNFSDVKWAMSEPDERALEVSNKKICLDAAYAAQLTPEQRKKMIRFPDLLGGPGCQLLEGVIPRPRTNAEIWLRSSAGSPSRKALWDELGKGDAAYKLRLGIQGGEGTWTRFPLTLLIAVGLAGGILLLAWLAIRIFTQAAVAFVLTIAAPVAMLMPAFGERGRAGFVAWGTTLLGAVLSKLVYSALLAIVLFATGLIGGLAGGGGVGTMMAFLLQAGLWWALFLKRDDLLSFISIPGHDGAGAAGGNRFGWAARVSQAYAMHKMFGGRGGDRRGGCEEGGESGSLPGDVVDGMIGRREDRSKATSNLASEQLTDRANRRLEAGTSQAQDVVGGQRQKRVEMAQAMRLAGTGAGGARSKAHDAAARKRAIAALQKTGATKTEAQAIAKEAFAAPARTLAGGAEGNGGDLAERSAKAGRRATELQSEISSGRGVEKSAKGTLASDARNNGRLGAAPSARALAAQREQIRSEVNAPEGSSVHAWRVGMSPQRYEALEGRERLEAKMAVRKELKADRLAFGAIPSSPESTPKRRSPESKGQRKFRSNVRGEHGMGGRNQLSEARMKAWRERRAERKRPSRRGVSR